MIHRRSSFNIFRKRIPNWSAWSMNEFLNISVLDVSLYRCNLGDDLSNIEWISDVNIKTKALNSQVHHHKLFYTFGLLYVKHLFRVMSRAVYIFILEYKFVQSVYSYMYTAVSFPYEDHVILKPFCKLFMLVVRHNKAHLYQYKTAFCKHDIRYTYMEGV